MAARRSAAATIALVAREMERDLPADSPGRTPLRAPLNEFSSSGVRFEITRTCAPALGTRFECVGLHVEEAPHTFERGV